MKPIAIEAANTIHVGLPTVAATAPIENRTSGGTPLATQRAPVQSMPRFRPADAAGSAAAVSPLSDAARLLCAPLNGLLPVDPRRYPRLSRCARRPNNSHEWLPPKGYGRIDQARPRAPPRIDLLRHREHASTAPASQHFTARQ